MDSKPTESLRSFISTRILFVMFIIEKKYENCSFNLDVCYKRTGILGFFGQIVINGDIMIRIIVDHNNIIVLTIIS